MVNRPGLQSGLFTCDPSGLSCYKYPMSKRTKRAILVVVTVLVLIGAALAAYYYGRVVPLIKAGKEQGTYSSERPSVGRFGFETEDGAHRTIADLKGRVVVVDVWATWCGTCIYSIPKIVSLHERYLDKPVKVIGLDVDEEGWEKVKPFLQKRPEITYTIAVPYPPPSFLLQSIVDLSPLGKVSAIPTVFVIDKQGSLAGKFVDLGHEEEIESLVARLLEE